MIEKKDASYDILATPYSVSLEDSFRGTITPVGGGTGSDIDSLWLDFDRAGRYKVILEETSGVRGSLLYMDVKDPQLGDRVLGTDGRAEVTLNIAGETRRPVYIGDQERRLGGDYTLSIEYLDLPPFGPSFITRVCGFDLDNHGFRFGQARRARSPQIAQALGALAVASGFRATNAA